ncbi:MAG TPA: universal stress protein [Gaiellaceae bacterium]|jgi:nucleotide-binding universal stress UspA family protein|nr:universal stress protein [Gaiellaceae bacterium]
MPATTGKRVESRSDRPRRGILLCYDDSTEAEHALERVAEIAATVPSRVTVVSVAEPTYQKGPFTDAADSIEAEMHSRLLEKAIWALSDHGIAAATLQPTGAPATSIVDIARQIGADLVVVGSRHRGLVRRLLFGSVSADVVADAPCDVLVVR